ncbi:hypothetical protein [Streptomyces clavuligerus]|uniref:hypothetical protein n=1 Tax=Streptomyces clavuligerus TaxID=1901 RepID=UPI000180089E|nr:hypothetical protein [Streptomyces clavuligerus]EDY52672.1 hypothetical protein SSCG_05715 [Streptomyces clavuligerus]WDN56040.1 hypothetical protein LL058_29595 [Streptomyces clavuligerus]
MDKRFEGFLSTYLDSEQGHDTSGDLRRTLMSFSESYVEAVREGLQHALQDESFGPPEYERLTNIEFPDVESLRAYLQALYAYLFEDAEQQPTPPEE